MQRSVLWLIPVPADEMSVGVWSDHQTRAALRDSVDDDREATLEGGLFTGGAPASRGRSGSDREAPPIEHRHHDRLGDGATSAFHPVAKRERWPSAAAGCGRPIVDRYSNCRI